MCSTSMFCSTNNTLWLHITTFPAKSFSAIRMRRKGGKCQGEKRAFKLLLHFERMSPSLEARANLITLSGTLSISPVPPTPPPTLTACQQRAAKERSECGGIGCFITQCNDDGTFPSMQCHSSSGYCHCEDEDGNKIAGTDHRPFILTIDCDAKRGEWIMNTARE